jgi:proteasome-associated ATPase
MSSRITEHDAMQQLHVRIDELAASNQQLIKTLGEAREQLVSLHDEVERLSTPPNSYGVFISHADDGLILASVNGRKMRVALSPEVDADALHSGVEVVLNDSMNVIGVGQYVEHGELVTFKELLSDGTRALVKGRGDEDRVVRLAEPLVGVSLRVGESLLCDSKSDYVLERVAKSDVETLVLEEVPDIDYADIGGLGDQIELIRDAVELPFLHPELYAQYQLKAPKGILLYGPPGCGKTLIAKAVANSLAKKVNAGEGAHRSYFLNIKGPELLNKYVGESERQIRMIFQQAREKASSGSPVIVFFDEMDSLFRTRGTGVSSDVETTIVPQLLSEIDGVERLDNVIVIGASNREDMIDPAILRPGRLDVKIKVERPDAQSAAEIFSKYLTADVPLHADDLAAHGSDVTATIQAMIRGVVDVMYATTEDNQFLEVTYINGDKEVLYFKDFSSGAMIENIVSRAKKFAIKAALATGVHGVRLEHLIESCFDEFHENEDLPNTTNPDDWARISGKKGERIVFMRTLMQSKKGAHSGRTIDTSLNSPYL